MIESVPMLPEHARQLHEKRRVVDQVEFPIAGAMLSLSRFSRAVLRDGEPVAGVGAMETRPGEYVFWLIATGDLWPVRFTLVKTVCQLMRMYGAPLKKITMTAHRSVAASPRFNAYLRAKFPALNFKES